MEFIKSIGRMLIVGIIFMIVRSPIAMFLIGITIGVFFYHWYPSSAQASINYFSVGFDNALQGVYDTPIADLQPESRGEYNESEYITIERQTD